MTSALKDPWFLMYTDEQEFRHFLPLAKKGDIKAIKRVIVYYRHEAYDHEGARKQEMEKQEQYWTKRLIEAAPTPPSS